MKSRFKILTLLILVVVDTSIGYSKSHSLIGLTQTITFTSIPDKTYGGVPFALNASTDSNLDITYTSSDPGIASIAGNIVTIYAAGTVTITASQDGDGTYNPATPVQQTLTINKATLTATADDKSISYGDADPVFTVTPTGFLNGDDETLIDAIPDATSVATSTSVAGVYAITAGDGGDSNYNFNYVDGHLTINKATLTVQADDKSRIYGDANPSFTVSLSGFKNGENETVIDAIPDATSLATATSVAGVYDITAVGGVDSNYDFNYVDGHLTISKSTLTVKADDKSRIYGDENPLFTVSISGFKNGEDQTYLDAIPEGLTAETPTSDVGVYPITASGGVDTNYDFSFVDGVLTITKVNLVATADNQERGYGDPNDLTITYVGFKNNDTPDMLATQPVIQCTATETSDLGNYPITLADGSDNNYNISMFNGSLSVVKSILTITSDDKSKLYASENPVLTLSYSGFRNNETSSVLDTPPSLNCDATQSSNAGAYLINVSGASDDHYDFAYVNGSLTINKVTLTTTADNKSRIYLENNPTLTFTYSGFVNGESESVLDTPPTLSCLADINSDAGNYAITISGGSDNNYEFNYVNGVLTINKASQIITFANLDNVVESVGGFELTASSSSGLPVIFATENLDKITITNSTVSIISPGKITITALQDGNSNYLAATPIDQTICILPKKPTITSSGIVTAHPTLISSSNSGNQWYQDNILLVDANNSTYVVDSDGMYTVQVTIEGCASEISEPYSAIVLGVEPSAINDFKIYPIPAKSELNFNLPSVTEIEVSEIFIYDLSGRLVIKESITGNKNKIDVSNLAPALYLLKVVNQQYTSTSRFITE